MATVLLAWEAGEGINYARLLVTLARALQREGHVPILALKNLAEAYPVVREEFPVLPTPQAPAVALTDGKPFVASSFADILALKGFSSFEQLWPLVRGWQGLLDTVRPQFLVTAYAPALSLTTFGYLPRIAVANGWFGMPPSTGETFPALVPGRPPLLPDDAILGVVREVQARRGQSSPASLPALLATEHRFLMMLPELDAYRSHRCEPHWDPVDPLPGPASPPRARTFFAYLNPAYPRMREVLQALVTRGWEGTVFVRGTNPTAREGLRALRLRVLDRPADHRDMLEPALILHHGGVGTAQNALASGRPQLILPMHLEHEVNCRTLHALGVCHYLLGPYTASDVAGAAEELTTSQRFLSQVAHRSREIQNRPRRPPLPGFLEACRECATRLG